MVCSGSRLGLEGFDASKGKQKIFSHEGDFGMVLVVCGERELCFASHFGAVFAVLRGFGLYGNEVSHTDFAHPPFSSC